MNSAISRLVVLVGLMVVLGVSQAPGNSEVLPGELPEPVLKGASEYLIRNLGEAFFSEYVTLFRSEFNKGSSCDTDELRRGPHFEVGWQIDIPERPWVHEFVFLEVSVDGAVAHGTPYSDVPDCVSDPVECEFPIDEEQARRIASDAGFPVGLAPWRCHFGWLAQRRTYAWFVKTTLMIDGDKSRSGEVLLIDANTGDVYNDRFTWDTR